MKYCSHGYLVPLDLASLSADIVLSAGGLISPFCLDCWAQLGVAELLGARFYEKPAVADPCTYGFCDLIAQVVRNRAWGRDSFAREAKESDLRFRLLEKKSVIEAAIIGKDKPFIDNYIRRTLKNHLTNDQTRGANLIAQNSVSLTHDGPSKRYRPQTDEDRAGMFLTDVTGGDSAGLDDELSLDKQGTLVSLGHDEPEVESGKKKRSEARNLFDKLQAEALSQIATLTGERKDGFDTRLDLEKALSKLPEDQQDVFASIYLENGELLNRPRTYDEAIFLTGLTLQEVRTLERKATDALRPALAPSFYRRAANR